MRKLKLQLDDLKVTSFQTDTTAHDTDGSVHAHLKAPVQETEYQTCANTYCGEYSCGCVDLSARTLCGIEFTMFCAV